VNAGGAGRYARTTRALLLRRAARVAASAQGGAGRGASVGYRTVDGCSAGPRVAGHRHRLVGGRMCSARGASLGEHGEEEAQHRAEALGLSPGRRRASLHPRRPSRACAILNQGGFFHRNAPKEPAILGDESDAWIDGTDECLPIRTASVWQLRRVRDGGRIDRPAPGADDAPRHLSMLPAAPTVTIHVGR
jgi:hypothetical protein